MVPKDCGIIALFSEQDSVHFGMAHCSASMAYGYWEPSMVAPRCCIDRQPNHNAISPKIVTFGARARS